MHLSQQCISSFSLWYTYFAEGSLSLQFIPCQSLGLNIINLTLPHSWKVHTMKKDNTISHSSIASGNSIATDRSNPDFPFCVLGYIQVKMTKPSGLNLALKCFYFQMLQNGYIPPLMISKAHVINQAPKYEHLASLSQRFSYEQYLSMSNGP